MYRIQAADNGQTVKNNYVHVIKLRIRVSTMENMILRYTIYQ